MGDVRDNSRTGALEEVAEAVKNLQSSPLYEYRIKNKYSPVIGEGDVHADIMFIGEAPGKQEAQTDRPFVGAAGRILNELLQSIGLERKDVYITNIVKDRPPENRDPTPEEIELYAPFLSRQIEIIQPKIIATLGRFAMDFVLERFNLPQAGQKISRLHGQPLQAEAPHGSVTIVPLFHPAVALYVREQQSTLEKDFQTLKRVL